jgi:predicted Fe-Mo cluster-binding NifX family protein
MKQWGECALRLFRLGDNQAERIWCTDEVADRMIQALENAGLRVEVVAEPRVVEYLITDPDEEGDTEPGSSPPRGGGGRRR